jgi:hypothetical protein
MGAAHFVRLTAKATVGQGCFKQDTRREVTGKESVKNLNQDA